LSDVDSHAISDDKVKRSMLSLNYKSLHSYQSYQIDAWLGQAGREICIKLFNSLLTMHSEDLGMLIDMADKDLKKLLTERNVQYQNDNSFFSDYFSLQIMVLLNKGVYSRRNPMPNNLKPLIISTIRKRTKEHCAQLVNSLNQLWKPIIADKYIEDIILNLTVQFLYKNNLEFTQEVIKRVASSFLLYADKELLKSIEKIF